MHNPRAAPLLAHLFCMSITAACMAAHHRNISAARTKAGESAGSDSMSMLVKMDQ